MRDNLREAKLIGPEDDEESLSQYSNNLFNRFVKEQLQFYPNGQRIIDSWLIQAGDLFDSVIIDNEIPVSEMPPIQLSTILLEKVEGFEKWKKQLKEDLINAAFRELKDAVARCNIPSLDVLMETTLENQVNWDPVSNFQQSELQSNDSYREQLFAIKNCVKSIDDYMNVMKSTYTKNVMIVGFPGGGKTFIMMYVLIYAISKGLCIISVAMMAHRACQLGGWHWHKLLRVPVDRGNNMSVHRMIEVALEKLERHPEQIQFIKNIHIFFDDEAGQRPAQFDDVCDGILRAICGINLYKAGKHSISTFDPTQLQPINGLPFMISPNILPCYNAVQIKNSVRAQDGDFFRIQEIARTNYKVFETQRHLLTEFKNLCEGFSFVNSWDDPLITPQTFRIYARNVPAKQANREYIQSTKQSVPHNLRTESKSKDLEKQRYANQDWVRATPRMTKLLDTELKEPDTLLFFKGAIFQCTYNEDEVFSQSQLALCYDVPPQDDVDRFRRIKILIFPSTLKLDSFDFDPAESKDHFINELGFREVSISCSPERQVYLDNTRAKRQQYGLKHYVTGTIHSAMGDTYFKMAVSVSDSQDQFKLWDSGQLIVILSRTRIMKNTIFVGPKQETIRGLISLLTKRTQWIDYMDQVVDVISLKEEATPTNSTLDQNYFPYRIKDISLPQDQTGAVYFLLSKKDMNFVYIDFTFCLRTRLISHNQGHDSRSYPPYHLRPFVLIAYICGCNRNRDLMEYLKTTWWDHRDNNVFQWAKNGSGLINDNEEELRIVYLFKE